MITSNLLYQILPTQHRCSERLHIYVIAYACVYMCMCIMCIHTDVYVYICCMRLLNARVCGQNLAKSEKCEPVFLIGIPPCKAEQPL